MDLGICGACYMHTMLKIIFVLFIYVPVNMFLLLRIYDVTFFQTLQCESPTEKEKKNICYNL